MASSSSGLFGGRRRRMRNGVVLTDAAKANAPQGVAAFKSSPFSFDHVLDPERPFFTGACQNCTPVSKNARVEKLLKLEGLTVASDEEDKGLWERLRGWMWKEEEEAEKGSEEKELAEKVLSNEIVQMIVEEYDENAREEAEKRVERMVKGMNLARPRKSLSSSLASALLVGGGGKVVYHPGQLKVIRDAAQGPGHPMAFVTFGPRTRTRARRAGPAHLAWALLHQKADVDPVRLVCFREEAKELESMGRGFSSVPVTMLCPGDEERAAGRMVGGEGDGDSDVVDSLTNAVEYSASFVNLEGGCSLVLDLKNSDGLIAFEKREILNDMSVMIQDGRLDDITVVPFAVSGDHVLDEHPLADGGDDVLTRVAFDQPFSLKEYVKNWMSQHPIRDGDDAEAHDRRLMRDLTWHLEVSTCKQTRVMATELLAFVKLFSKDLPGDGLVEKFAAVRHEITMVRVWDVGFSGENADVVEYADRLLGGTEDPQVLLPLSKPVVFALAKKSMAAAAALAVIRSPQVPIQCLAGTHASPRPVEREKLVAAAKLLQRLLCCVFPLLKPCEDADEVMGEAVNDLKVDDLLVDTKELEAKQQSEHLQATSVRRMARHVDRALAEDEEDERVQGRSWSDVLYTVSLEPDAVSRLLFLRSLVTPYVEAMFSVVCALLDLGDGDALAESDLHEHAQGRDVFFDTVNQLEFMGVLDRGFRASPEGRVLRLLGDWREPARLVELKKYIQMFT